MQNLGHQARPSAVPSDNCVSKETGASSPTALMRPSLIVFGNPGIVTLAFIQLALRRLARV
jgi:hypothetical protein